jgi:hypothetical protein
VKRLVKYSNEKKVLQAEVLVWKGEGKFTTQLVGS